jgi:hypothetical protein
MGHSVGYTRFSYGGPRKIETSWVMVPGNTYPIKDKLKDLGCKFGEKEGRKGWYHAPDTPHADEIQEQVASLPPAPDYSKWILIRGKTFAVKEALKSGYGARWSQDHKTWLVAPDQAEAAQALVDAVNAPKEEVA